MQTRLLWCACAAAMAVAAAPLQGQDKAQEVQVERRVIIRGADGQMREVTDPDEMRQIEMRVEAGGPGQVRVGAIMMGPDGQVFTWGDVDPTGLGGAVVSSPGGPTVSFVDPARSYLVPLARRADVQRHLEMDIRQRTALEEAAAQSSERARAALREHGHKLGEQAARSRSETGRVSISMGPEMLAAIQAASNGPVVELEKILRPEQLERLKQIDRQYRGPLALASEAVGALVPVDGAQRAALGPLLAEYRKKMAEGNRAVRDLQRAQQQAAAGQGQSAGRPLSAIELRSRLIAVRREVEAARKAQGDRALEQLADEQRAAWKRLQGSTFRFRD